MNADPSFFVCQRHLLLHVSASGAGAVSNFLGTQGLLCNRAFQNTTCCLSPSQLRRALREDWHDLDGLVQAELRKRKSKFDADELKLREEVGGKRNIFTRETVRP